MTWARNSEFPVTTTALTYVLFEHPHVLSQFPSSKLKIIFFKWYFSHHLKVQGPFCGLNIRKEMLLFSLINSFDVVKTRTTEVKLTESDPKPHRLSACFWTNLFVFLNLNAYLQ